MVQDKGSKRLQDLGAGRVGGKDLWLGPKPPARLDPRGIPGLRGRIEIHLCSCC